MKNVVLNAEQTQPQNLSNSDLQIWIDSLPDIPLNHFLLHISDLNNLTVFCVKELDWQTSMNIDMKAFHASDKNESYYSEEYERRCTLSRAIAWVADFETQTIVINQNFNILEKLTFEIIENIWQQYKLETNVTVQEAQLLYESTKKYLNNEAQEGIPLPSIIPETIAICDGWCSLSSKELKTLSASDWERMQIIKMARADLMGIYTSHQIHSQSKMIGTVGNINIVDENDEVNTSNAPWAHLPLGHPNRPPGI